VLDGNLELSVLVDRAVGGSSIRDGQIELMLHRYFCTSFDSRLTHINLISNMVTNEVFEAGGCFMMILGVLVRHLMKQFAFFKIVRV